ncbi:hypothetical protein [Reinekea sp.]|uniref:hypothetical protein n=1 Tax=Reinekea sp. TaxID=1970455 RepID=UPI00257BF848|nr:hypothetical protein [Reinekea sp.]
MNILIWFFSLTLSVNLFSHNLYPDLYGNNNDVKKLETFDWMATIERLYVIATSSNIARQYFTSDELTSYFQFRTDRFINGVEVNGVTKDAPNHPGNIVQLYIDLRENKDKKDFLYGTVEIRVRYPDWKLGKTVASRDWSRTLPIAGYQQDIKKLSKETIDYLVEEFSKDYLYMNELATQKIIN